MSKEDLHILMLEDNQFDAELNIEQLRLLEEYNCIVKVIQEKDDYINEIEANPPPELILCDYKLPRYNGMEALKDLNSRQLLIPFIFVTGTMQEEVAVDAIKAGAWEYVVKDRLFRLPLAIRSVLKLKKEKEIALEAERRSQRLFKAIEETTAQIIVLDRMSNIEYVNKNFTIVTGYSPDEVLGAPISNCFFKDENGEGHIYLQDLILKKKVFKGDIINRKKNGEKYWEHISITPIFNAQNEIHNYIIIKEDITQQKKVEHDLVVSEERLNLALTGANLGLWDWDVSSGKLSINKRWAEMIDYTIEEIKLNINTWKDLIHPEDLDEVMTILNKHLNGETAYYMTEYRLKTKSGDWKWVLDRGKVLERDENGKALRAAGTHMDITNRKQAEFKLNQTVKEYLSLNEELTKSLERIEKINIDLEKSKLKAEESDNLKTAFLANLSHEIRTPMNGILGFADLLKEDNLTKADQNRYIHIIERSGNRMLKLINNLVDISKIESNQVEIKPEKTNLNEIMDKVFDFFKPLADQKRIYLEVKKGLPKNMSSIIIDSLKLEQVLTNLINNALKFTTKGSIHFGYSVSEDMLVFHVKDTGIGIPPGKKELIFERFRQVENTYYSGTEGSGLGLSISKAFIELMGGKIWVDSEVQKGSEFSFTLPYVPEKIKKAEEQNQSDHLFDKGITVLIVEDDEVSYLYLKHIMMNKEFNILHAENGKEAIQFLNDHPEVKLILMDMKMPLMNGIDATKEIRRRNLKIPIIAQTAYTSEVDRAKALEAGCNDYIIKPIKNEKLLEKMAHLLNADQ